MQKLFQKASFLYEKLRRAPQLTLALLLLLIVIPLAIFFVKVEITNKGIEISTRQSTPTSPYASVYKQSTGDIPLFAYQFTKNTYVPSPFPTDVIKPSVNSDGVILDPFRYNAVLNLPEKKSMILSVRYLNTTGGYDDRHITITQPQVTQAVNTTNATTLTTQVFTTTPKGTWKCSTIENSQSTLCENVWEEDNIKKGIGIVSPIPYSEKKQTSLFYCEYYKNGNSFTKTSCYQ